MRGHTMRTVTCHTEGCDNAEHPIDMEFPDDGTVMAVCGVCGQTITDVR